MLIVVAGVSGSGKSTIGALLAARLHVPFADADDLHPASNVEKMRRGQPLDDEDRWPWLAAVGRELAAASSTGLVMACSALTRRYRDAILAQAPEVRFVLLEAGHDVLEHRMLARTDHFMPPSLLGSQLATLEPLGADEPGATVLNAGDPSDVVDAIVLTLSPS